MQSAFRQMLKAKAHHLKPVVIIGSKGLTPSVIEETQVALIAHELIKVKVGGVEKEERQLITSDLCQALDAELVQLIGHIAIIYRKNEDR